MQPFPVLFDLYDTYTRLERYVVEIAPGYTAKTNKKECLLYLKG